MQQRDIKMHACTERTPWTHANRQMHMLSTNLMALICSAPQRLCSWSLPFSTPS